MLQRATQTNRPSRPKHLYVVPDREVARADHVPPGRTLHLVDIENLLGGPSGTRREIEMTAAAYREAANLQPTDHVIVGANPMLGVDVGLVWSGSLLVVGRGPDGADLALMGEVQDTDWVAARFDRIVIGSGDKRFVTVASGFRPRGIAVGVVCLRSALGRALAENVDFVRYLPRQGWVRKSS